MDAAPLQQTEPMPFTPSHAVAILPFARTPLAPAALALGSMAPDLPYFLPFGISRDFSHSLPGVPTIDLLVGAVAFLLWVLVLRAPVLDYAPRWLRERMAPRPKWRIRGRVISGLTVIAALEIGILTHLLLDLFTHEGGWLETVAPWTSDRIGTFTIANLVHAGVSVVTTLIIAWWVRRWVQRTPRVPRESKLMERERVSTWIMLVLILGITGLAWWARGIAAGRNPLEMQLLFISFCVAVATSGAVGLILSIVWHVRHGQRRSEQHH